MPDQPVDDHSEEFEQLAGLSALRVLDGDELERFEQHAEHCERCQVMVRLDRQALMGVSLVAPEMDPSPDFKQRLMQRAAAELAASVAVAETTPAQPQSAPAEREPTPAEREPTPVRAPPNVVPFRRRTSTWVGALAALLVLGLVTVGAYSYENQPVARYNLSGSAPGTASVVLRRSGAADLEMQGVPDPGPGYVYEAWVIPDGKAPVAAGVTSTGNATLPLPGDVRGSTVAITREPGRVDAPTSAPVMATEVQS
jgi:Anti-sigma-K factor rskA